MGKLLSKCFKWRRSDSDYVSLEDVFRFPFQEKITTPLSVNDSKFLYFPKEQKVDRIIAYLDEIRKFSERDLNLLEQTLTELRTLMYSNPPLFSHSYLKHGSDFNEPESGETKIESQNETSEDNRQGSLEEKDRPSAITQKKGVAGTFLIEIQKAHFFHLQVLTKQKLRSPYVVVKIYENRNKYLEETIEKIPHTDALVLRTLISTSPDSPEWYQLFEYSIPHCEETPFQRHIVGVSLFYFSGTNSSAAIQIGEEQLYSFSVLMNQRVQEKQIDFRSALSRGVIARLSVRFQLLYDLELAKMRNLRDITTRMQKLMKIRKRCTNSSPDYDKIDYRGYPAKMLISETNSLASSVHENDEGLYYFSENV